MQIDSDAQDPATHQLQQDWDQLSDLDRALAIAKIKKSGLSNRKIAQSIGRSESLMRRRHRLTRPSAIPEKKH